MVWLKSVKRLIFYLFILTGIDKNKMLYEVAKWSDKYGPVVTVRLGKYTSMLSICCLDESLLILGKGGNRMTQTLLKMNNSFAFRKTIFI